MPLPLLGHIEVTLGASLKHWVRLPFLQKAPSPLASWSIVESEVWGQEIPIPTMEGGMTSLLWGQKTSAGVQWQLFHIVPQWEFRPKFVPEHTDWLSLDPLYIWATSGLLTCYFWNQWFPHHGKKNMHFIHNYSPPFAVARKKLLKHLKTGNVLFLWLLLC